MIAYGIESFGAAILKTQHQQQELALSVRLQKVQGRGEVGAPCQVFVIYKLAAVTRTSRSTSLNRSGKTALWTKDRGCGLIVCKHRGLGELADISSSRERNMGFILQISSSSCLPDNPSSIPLPAFPLHTFCRSLNELYIFHWTMKWLIIYCYGTISSCGHGLPSSGQYIEMPLLNLVLNLMIICNSWVTSADIFIVF